MADEVVDVDRFVLISEPSANGALMIIVQGELDLAHASELKVLLTRELGAGRSVLLDLSEVQFIDSTGLAAIVSALNHTRDSGCELQLVGGLQPQARRLMELTGVLPMLSPADANGSA
jgi:anti-sigma B factor antagonist